MTATSDALAARSTRAKLRLPRLAREPAVVVGLGLLFVAISAWWLSVDYRVPNGDSGKHMMFALGASDALAHGDLARPFTVYTQYPPLLHVVGGLGALVGGFSPTALVLTENLVFVPLLCAGCYGAGRVAFGPYAGMLAAAFALATPMLISLFHVFMLDAPLTAMVAVTVWLLLASRRFSSLRLSALAGVAAGLGMYAKGTFVLFIAGLVLVMLLRGGWRAWPGWLAFAAIAGALAGPWYLGQKEGLAMNTAGAVVGEQGLWYARVPYPDRWELANFTWYGWNLINNQTYFPLALLFVVGLVILTTRWLRRRERDSYVPELLGGGLFGYLAISLITLDDPRYTLPLLVYVAVFATGWIAQVRRPTLRRAATAAVFAILVVNTVLQNFAPLEGRTAVRLPGAVDGPLREYQLTLASSSGYFEGKPDARGKSVLGLLRQARAEGVQNVIFHPESLNRGYEGYNLNGLAVFAHMAALGVPGFTRDLVRDRGDMFVVRAKMRHMRFAPCITSPLDDAGVGLYVFRGRAPLSGRQLRRARPDCPAAAR
jgi:hypothetical protein